MMEFNYSFQPKINCKYDAERGYGFAISPGPSGFEDLRDSWPGEYFLIPVPSLLIDVPNGNYQVKLTLGDDDQPSNKTVKEGLRHLRIDQMKIKSWELITISVSIH